VIYDILFKASAETMITIAADPKHLGARIGVLSILHTWGSALTHHPHDPHDRARAAASRLMGRAGSPAEPTSSSTWVFSHVLFRRLVSWRSSAARHSESEPIQFFGKHASLSPMAARAFGRLLWPPLTHRTQWVGLQQTPFGGTQASVALPGPLHPSCRHL